MSTVAAPCRYGAFMGNAQRFDSAFFSLSPVEVNAMDPQQRLLLELGYSTLHTVGERQASLTLVRS